MFFWASGFFFHVVAFLREVEQVLNTNKRWTFANFFFLLCMNYWIEYLKMEMERFLWEGKKNIWKWKIVLLLMLFFCESKAFFFLKGERKKNCGFNSTSSFLWDFQCDEMFCSEVGYEENLWKAVLNFSWISMVSGSFERKFIFDVEILVTWLFLELNDTF